MGILRKKWNILIASILLLAILHLAPLEENYTGLFNPLYVLLKMTLSLMAISPLVYGAGAFGYNFFSHIHRKYFSTEDKLTIYDNALVASSMGFLGVIVLGTMMFCFGLFLNGGFAAAVALMLGCVMYGLGFTKKSTATKILSKLKEQVQDHFNTLDKKHAYIMIFVAALVLLKLLTAFMYQSHGDPYSYNVSASDRWIRLGKTGLTLSDIHTGYALAVENFYYFLRIIFRGHTEQYVVGTLSQVVFGYAPFVLALVAMAVRMSAPVVGAILVVFLLQSPFTFYAWQPRNDAFFAASIALGLAGLALRLRGIFFIAAACAFSIKMPTAISFLALGVAYVACSLRKRDFETTWKAVMLLLVGAFFMVLFWSPFAINNFLLTGNPLFPLANEIFKSPFAPTQFIDVIDDMKPFSLTFLGFFRGLWALFLTQPMFILGSICLLIIRFGHFSYLRTKLFASGAGTLSWIFLLLNFLLVQIATREYTPDFASRFVIGTLGPLAMLSVATSWVLLERIGRNVALVVLLVLSCYKLGPEVSFQKLAHFFTTQNQTADLFEKKPILALNRYLNDYLAWVDEPGATDSAPKVISVAGNLSYFLLDAEFWHETKTYPMWSWDLSMSPEQWQDKIQSHKIGFGIYDTKDPVAIRGIARVPHKVLKEAGTLVLVKWGL